MAYYATYKPNELGELQKVVINAGVGFCLPFYGETAPPGTLACDGSEISREAYKELFQVLGTKAGAGDGATTFNLPDFRGDFIRCVGGNAAGLGVEQSDAIQNIEGMIGRSVQSEGTASVPTRLTGVFYSNSEVSAPTYARGNAGQYQSVVFDASRVVRTANEVRPVNVALLWCIIYE